MASKLKQYFPIIHERENLMKRIQTTPVLRQEFDSWQPKWQEEFLDFCTGARGVKILYDSFFKEVLNAEYTPDRLNRLLSVLLKTNVRIKYILPGDSTRIADEKSLLIMDIVVELDDGSLVNVEAQKIGYIFPGQRSACYSADLLLRQYKRIRDERKKKFSYREVKEVYTIVFIEDSAREFKNFPDNYLHYFEQRSDTGLELDLLQKYLFVPLDIFSKKIQNRGIKNETEAWLAFLSQDDPEIILRLIDTYPEFKPMYENVYRLCQNVEKVMGMFSEELRILDQNTVQYMIDEMQADLDKKDAQLAEKDAKIADKDSAIIERDAKIAEKDAEIKRLRQLIAEGSKED